MAASRRIAGATKYVLRLSTRHLSTRETAACEARAIDERTVRNSGGGIERRYIVKTLLKLGEQAWSIELALANRDQMGFRMLLGRTALEGRALIEPGRSYVLGARPPRRRRRRASPLRPSKLLR